MKKQLSVRLDEEIIEKLRRLAEKRGYICKNAPDLAGRGNISRLLTHIANEGDGATAK